MSEKRDICVSGVEVTVEYDYDPPCRGARERGTGMQLEPDYDASVSVISICIGDQDITDIVGSKFTDEVAEEVMTQISDGIQSDIDDAADHAYEAAREDRQERERWDNINSDE